MSPSYNLIIAKEHASRIFVNPHKKKEKKKVKLKTSTVGIKNFQIRNFGRRINKDSGTCNSLVICFERIVGFIDLGRACRDMSRVKIYHKKKIMIEAATCVLENKWMRNVL